MFSLADWKCQRCDNPHDELHVHHTRYFNGREPWEYDEQWLSVLCATCHSKEHHDKLSESEAAKDAVFKRNARVHYITLHEDLYEACAENPCSAMILDYLMREHCRLLKLHPIASTRSEWALVQKVSVAFLVDVLVWSYSKNTISQSIQQLSKLGFIRILKRRPKNSAYDRRHYLEVIPDAIQTALDSNGGAR